MNWSRIIPWILVVVLGVILYLDLRTHPVAPVDGPGFDSVTYWKTVNGQLVASLRATQDQLAQAPAKYRDSIAAVLKTTNALLKEVIDLKLHGVAVITGDSGHRIEKTYTGDSLTSASQVFSNPYYQVVANLNFRNDLLSTVQVQTWDSLLLAWHTVRTGGIFNRKTFLQLDIKNTNPYNTVTNAQVYRAPDLPQKKWVLAVGAGWGYGFNVAGGSNYGYPVIGLFLGRTLLKF